MSNNLTQSVSIIKFPWYNFKIKSKKDAEVFINDAMCNNNTYTIIVNKETAYIFEKVNNEVCVYEKKGDLSDIFNPLLEVANTANKFYKDSTVDYVWNLRKYINAKFFNERN